MLASRDALVAKLGEFIYEFLLQSVLVVFIYN